jgi:hypothetical protein
LGNHYTVPRRGIYLQVKEVEKVERGRGRKKMMASPEQDRIEILVERDKLLIENKSVNGIQDIHLAQMLSYLRLSGISVGI